MSAKQSAFLGLVVLVGAANLGLAARLYWPTALGQMLFVATRIVLLGLPLVWYFAIERRRFTFPWPSTREVRHGVWLGAAMLAAIGLAYWQWGRAWLDIDQVRSTATALGLGNWGVFLAFALYFTVINAVVEEVIWRWFVYRHCEVLFPGTWAVGVAAACFTLHHGIALQGYGGNLGVTGLGCLGVFGAGAIWSACYRRYRTLWVSIVSHMLADLAIAIAAAHFLFIATIYRDGLALVLQRFS